MLISMHQDSSRNVQATVSRPLRSASVWVTIEVAEEHGERVQFFFGDPAQCRRVGEAFVRAADALQAEIANPAAPVPEVPVPAKPEDDIPF